MLASYNLPFFLVSLYGIRTRKRDNRGTVHVRKRDNLGVIYARKRDNCGAVHARKRDMDSCCSILM